MTEKELVTIEEMRAVENKTKKLEKLIAMMDELEQRKCRRDLFEEARDAVECRICFKQFLTEKPEDGLCLKCRKEIQEKERARKARIEAEKNWKRLTAELNSFLADGDDKYVLRVPDKKSFGQWGIKRAVGNHYVEIYPDSIMSRDSWSKVSHALRIKTDDYNVNANRLRGWFDTKNIAEKLHKKCEELLRTLTAKDESKSSKEKARNAIIRKIKAAFPNATDIRAEYRRTGAHRRYRESGYLQFTVVGQVFRTIDGEAFSFSLNELSVDKIARILNIINE